MTFDNGPLSGPLGDWLPVLATIGLLLIVIVWELGRGAL